MGIVFHCKHCGKKIDAPEKAAGRWGKCPSCHNKVYVPNPEADDELKLAPVDKEEEEQKRKLMEETYMLEQQILDERESKNQAETASGPKETGLRGHVDEDELYETIVRYLRQMADGELDQANTTLKTIESAGEIALKLIDRIALANIPEAELADVPPQVLAGLIRTLRSKIS